MIKTGIIGAHTAAAGELIRILINHPDVDLRTVASAEIAGQRIDSVHRGLIGDTDMVIASELVPQDLDAVFLCGEPWEARKWMEQYGETLDEDPENKIRVIDLTGAFRNGEYSMVYGLPEHNRKALVRGATRASIPSPIAMAVGLALFPLAKDMLLQGNVNASVTMAATEVACAPTESQPSNYQSVAISTRLDPIAPIENRPDSEDAEREILRFLKEVQPACHCSVKLQLSRNQTSPRGVIATVDTPCTLPLLELTRRYEEAYDDHNFTYIIDRLPESTDVANTNKCLLHLSYPATGPDPISASQSLRVTAVIDNFLKGSAGNAVHCLNLLFGLSERTGLSLKASAY